MRMEAGNCEMREKKQGENGFARGGNEFGVGGGEGGEEEVEEREEKEGDAYQDGDGRNQGDEKNACGNEGGKTEVKRRGNADIF